MFLNKIRNVFRVPDTKFVSATNVARAGKRGNIDFTLPNARRVYSSKGDPLGVIGIKRKNTKN